MTKDNSLLDEKALAIPIFGSCINKLTKSDAIIANFIANNISKVLEMTISDVATETKTSDVTISRFCKKLDLSGFQSLKVQLASFTNQKIDDVEVGVGDDVKTIASKIFLKIQEGLNMTQNVVDYDAIDRAANLIACSNRLMVFGYGTSGTICRDIGIRFVRFGIPTEVFTDPHQQATIAAMCQNYDTTVVVVSLSGSSIDLVHSVELAKNNGAKIVLITSHKRSPLAEKADEVLVGLGPEIKLLAESTVTRFAYLAIVDVLYTRVAILRNKLYTQNIVSMRKALAALKS
ncbi:MAG: MurR/RpiR family transcriptional regulator [Succinatimonas sp.]|nr:MurR/RpiR family transcriptional regulator [Succinatimonas sp.]